MLLFQKNNQISQIHNCRWAQKILTKI